MVHCNQIFFLTQFLLEGILVCGNEDKYESKRNIPSKYIPSLERVRNVQTYFVITAPAIRKMYSSTRTYFVITAPAIRKMYSSTRPNTFKRLATNLKFLYNDYNSLIDMNRYKNVILCVCLNVCMCVCDSVGGHPYSPSEK